eukprot:TRINITY_DN3688_c0_g1_i6.p1 TRINITY_DN3688_c0_g1~~TRINITY_DN3688_c0_g1_i6.p1  ORF type:complete len:102 (-),score=21.91 TRINITY_DN3688_c0_g1_i6:238-543(-)
MRDMENHGGDDAITPSSIDPLTGEQEFQEYGFRASSASPDISTNVTRPWLDDREILLKNDLLICLKPRKCWTKQPGKSKIILKGTNMALETNYHDSANAHA